MGKSAILKKNGLKVQEFFFDKDHPYDLAEKRRII